MHQKEQSQHSKSKLDMQNDDFQGSFENALKNTNQNMKSQEINKSAKISLPLKTTNLNYNSQTSKSIQKTFFMISNKNNVSIQQDLKVPIKNAFPQQHKNSNKDNQLNKVTKKTQQQQQWTLSKPHLGQQKLVFNIQNLDRKYTPYSYINYTSKYNLSKEKYLKVLSEIYNDNELQTLKNGQAEYKQIILKSQDLMRRTFSQKYLGVNDGQIGVMSKRVPFNIHKNIQQLSKSKIFNSSIENIKEHNNDHNQNQNENQAQFSSAIQNAAHEYAINNYFLPRQIHTRQAAHSEQQQNARMLKTFNSQNHPTINLNIQLQNKKQSEEEQFQLQQQKRPSSLQLQSKKARNHQRSQLIVNNQRMKRHQDLEEAVRNSTFDFDKQAKANQHDSASYSKLLNEFNSGFRVNAQIEQARPVDLLNRIVDPKRKLEEIKRSTLSGAFNY